MPVFQRLSQKYGTPLRVQRLLRGLAYNRERGGETVRSAAEAWRRRRAHCLEASFIAAAILEHRGYPPLVMSLESVDNLDHVVFVFRSPGNGRWGSVGRSRDPGLHGRPPVFPSLRALAATYQDPFVDKSGRLTGYGVASLDELGVPWRDSTRHLWAAEQALIELPHQGLAMSEKRFREMKAEYDRTGGHPRRSFWW